MILDIFELQTGPISQTMGRQIERKDGVKRFHQSIIISVPLPLLEIQGKSFIKLKNNKARCSFNVTLFSDIHTLKIQDVGVAKEGKIKRVPGLTLKQLRDDNKFH